MATLRQQIIAAVMACLPGTTAAGANIFRSRETNIARGASPAIVVTPSGEDTQRFGDSTDRSEFTFRLDILVRGDPWDVAADAIAEAAHRTLVADASVAALCTTLRRTAADYAAEEADRTAGCLTAYYRCTYLSRVGDIGAAP